MKVMQGAALRDSVSDTPPPSVTPVFQQGVVALSLVFGAIIVLWVRPTDNPVMAALTLLLCMAVPGALSELFLVRSWRDPATGIDFARVRPDLRRMLQKLVGLWTIYALLLCAYLFLPVYRQPLYASLQQVLPVIFPWLIALSIPYVALVDAVQREPEDRLWRFGGIILGQAGIDRTGMGNWLLGWLVKAFFLPLMFCFLTGYIRDLWAFSLDPEERTSQQAFVLVYQTLYFVDVAVGALGYCMTFRLLGTHIRSANPTLGGWIVAVACYPPFWDSIGGAYFAYNDDWEWGAWLWDHPVLYTVWGALILASIGIYAWATLAFGLRFSNLTHRGVITNGPYRYTKHPAYIAKNLSWWLTAIPFIPEDGSIATGVTACAMLAGINVIYWLRARTEETHLRADPDYRAYADWIDRNGLFRRR